MMPILVFFSFVQLSRFFRLAFTHFFVCYGIALIIVALIPPTSSFFPPFCIAKKSNRRLFGFRKLHHVPGKCVATMVEGKPHKILCSAAGSM